jgi:CRP-like cAMP-binding protein
VLESGDSAEIAVVGNEGIIGVALFMGGDTMPNRAVVQSSGWGCRLRAPLVQQEFNRNGPLLRLLLRFTQALITQMAQTAVCNRHHSVDQQLCSWLLLSLDRLAGNQLNMTQELIANMLGVRREGVTEAAGKLQRAGLIHYSRGHITVLDRQGLEARVCECYQVVKTESDRLLPALRNVAY